MRQLTCKYIRELYKILDIFYLNILKSMEVQNFCLVSKFSHKKIKKSNAEEYVFTQPLCHGQDVT